MTSHIAHEDSCAAIGVELGIHTTDIRLDPPRADQKLPGCLHEDALFHSPRRRHASPRPAFGAIAASGTTASTSRLPAALLGAYQPLILSEYAESIHRKANR